ncbi:unnamed protein product [Didymodactylos carnosus]|uniref:IST1 homolog n=1 Tax=Didymodactylos carnosus TaxID=1234261 RepID=A0A813ZTZ0_9BILA|nr:unnamed protein product [Didymodactylos carnosus]CAF0904120.1 unnamed protein product [Didymodactylos carnosus]CAF3530115.1 unnamed protein product [Didymodactylos carnosus]CAF3686181.1 unnamed protein product [Didymodactylos carnosus]
MAGVIDAKQRNLSPGSSSRDDRFTHFGNLGLVRGALESIATCQIAGYQGTQAKKVTSEVVTRDLKTVMQIARSRLDVREKKKTEQIAKERAGVAELVRINKVPRARIATEHIVREDYKIEAMEKIDAYIDILLMRIGLIKDRPKSGSIDPAVEKPLANILWASPFLQQDIPELAQITAIFKRHFTPEYVSMCEMNKIDVVDVDLVRCLSCDIIPKLLIEKYLIEITRSHNVAFEPDPIVMAQDEFWAIGQRYVQQPPPSDEKKYPPPPNDGSSFSGGGSGITGGLVFPNIPQSTPSAPQSHPPPPPSSQYPNINFGQPPPPINSSSGGAMYPPSNMMPGFGYQNQKYNDAPVVNNFPQIPSNDSSNTTGQSDDPGFDDLARRFEELKKRK